MTDFKEAVLMINKYAEAVGLLQIELPTNVSDVPPAPEGACLWDGTYAMLVLWPILIINSESIDLSWNDAQCWIDRLFNESKNSPAKDCYLIFLLEQEPDTETSDVVRKIMLNTIFCRKYFIWPNEEKGGKVNWNRILQIAPLGLPSSPKLVEMAPLPKLTSEQSTLVHDILDYSPTKIAKRDLGNIL